MYNHALVLMKSSIKFVVLILQMQTFIMLHIEKQNLPLLTEPESMP